MEIRAFEKFVKPYLTDEIPSEEGLYFFVKYVDGEAEVDLVDIIEDRGILTADSESWATYYDVHGVGIYEGRFPYKWSQKLNFK